MATRAFNFSSVIAELQATVPGRERDMYPRVRDLLVHVLGHPTSRVLVDAGIEGGRGIPDLTLKAPTGVSDSRGDPMLAEWAVFEVKDEPNAFSTPRSREAIFTEKSKYIGIGTEWFVMVDPTCIIARPVIFRSQLEFNPDSDIVVRWAGLTEDAFRTSLAVLHYDNAGLSASVKSFRAGDIKSIATVKLQVPAGTRLSNYQQTRLNHARRDFFETVAMSTAMLQQACVSALEAQRTDIEAIRGKVKAFSEKWEGHDIVFSPIRIRGKVVHGPAAAREHDAEASALKRELSRKPAISKLALQWLPSFHDRMGATTRDEHFAIETANLVLARMLLIRFFEDHGFFGQQKYVCNGGVAAFQQMMLYFGEGYTRLLRHAYEKAHEIYANVFDEMDLDWILGVEHEQLSRALELSMMWLSRFDFTTVKGDILTGIYDRFLDRQKRKDLGEFYTPPTIARYMVQRLGLVNGDSVIDPACGSGTFLIEAFEQLVGKDISSGRADFTDARRALANIAGIDINPFSAVVAQVQLLWHLLPMRDDILTEGFPELRIAERINALLSNHVEMQGTLFDELNRPVHAAVVGNPPYVRPERSTTALTGQDADAFAEIGGSDKNLYALFLYKALRTWCRDGDPAAGIPAGKVAFVLPLSFCDNDSTENVRRLFMVNGRFRIIEIVDLDVIADRVFDAKVNPIILIAENRPATAEDRVRIRVAGPECRLDDESRTFDLDRATSVDLAYGEIWTSDGRILTKLTAERKRILDVIIANNSLGDAAQHYWSGKRGARIESWQLHAPARMDAAGRTPDGLRWEESDMIRMGGAFRGRKPVATSPDRAFDFYKGENVVVGAIEGEPVETGIDIDGIDDNALWRFRDILPARGVAFLQISLGLTAAMFDPTRMAFLNTVTTLFPRADLQRFPFDLALASRVYQWTYALYLRCGAMSHGFRSHVYPSNLRLVPWSDRLAEHGDSIESLRPEFERLCEGLLNRAAALRSKLTDGNSKPLSRACAEAGAKINWAPAFKGSDACSVDAPSATSITVEEQADGFLLRPSNDVDWWVVVSDQEIARSLAVALTVVHESDIGRRGLLDLRIPDKQYLADFVAEVDAYDNGQGRALLDALIDRIDGMVGSSLGLTAEDVAFIQRDMSEDHFLRHIRPNLPHAGRRRRGLYESLASSDRYRSGA